MKSFTVLRVENQQKEGRDKTQEKLSQSRRDWDEVDRVKQKQLPLVVLLC